MINNFTYQVLPFYDSVSKQNFKQKWLYNDLCSSYLFCPKNKLLPFQLNRVTKYNTIQNVWLYCYNGTLQGDILSDISASDLKITTIGVIDYITYFGNSDLAHDLSCGLYYLKIYDGSQYWYSEVFKVENFAWQKSILSKTVISKAAKGTNIINLIASSGKTLIFKK